MGAYVCGASSGLDVAQSTIKILVLGFSGAGKTFVVYSWSLGMNNIIRTLPTDAAMFNVERIQTSSTPRPMYMWDISGKMVHRRRSYFLGTEGLVYVLDATESDVNEISADLESLVTDRDLKDLPLLVLVNKVVDGDTLSAAELKPHLQKHVHLPPNSAVCDIHLFSQEDLSDALTQLERLLNNCGPAKQFLGSL